MGRLRARITLFVLLLLTCGITFCYGRAGGGHGFGGGGGGGHGGGGGFGGGGGGGFHFSGGRSSGGGSFDPCSTVVFLIVLAFVIYAIYNKSQQTSTSNTIRRGFPAIDEARRGQALADLRQEDPTFSPTGFCANIQEAFALVQKAWSDMTLEKIRPFVSDGVFERFSLQIEEMKALGFRNVVENLQIRSVQIAQIDLDEAFQQIAVRIVASAGDYDVSLKDGKRLRTNTTSEFAEVWTFIRRRGVKTPEAGGCALVAGNCPNCGAAIELNQHAKCQQCGAVLRCGRYDWVLSEITQDSEWNGRSASDIPGRAALQERDPGFNVQSMEDLASVVFWRKMAAERTASAKPLRKIAGEEFCDRYEKGLGHAFYASCGVGSVDLLGILPADATDRAVVQIAWSGTRYFRQADGSFTRSEASGVVSQLFVLQRDREVKTNLDQAISSAHCPGCGGPIMQETSAACEFCGVVLNDGKHGWILTDVLPAGSTSGMQLLRECREQPGNSPDTATACPPALRQAPRGAAMVGWVIQMVMADGQLDPKEEQCVRQVAEKRGVAPEQVTAMLHSAQRGELQMVMPLDQGEARGWLEAMIEAAFADGVLASQELTLLERLAETQQLSSADLKLMIRQVQTRLFQQSREALRQQR